MDPVWIPLDVFQKTRENYSDEQVPHFLSRSIEQLKEKFPCITTSYVVPMSKHSHHEGFSRGHTGGHHRSNRNGSHNNHHAKKHERPRIGVKDQSRDDIARKDFVANMNKLTRNNYDSILRQIRTTYNSNFLQHYMEIVWNLMVRQSEYQDLHIQVIHHLEQLTPVEKKVQIEAFWSNLYSDFLDKQPWIPSDELLDSTTVEYDEFCDYIKWKKRTIAGLQAFVRLMMSQVIPLNYEKHFQSIITSIESACESANSKLLDCLFEFLLQMYVVIPSNTFIPVIDEMLLRHLKGWVRFVQEKSMPSSTKFKLMDLEEAITRKKST